MRKKKLSDRLPADGQARVLEAIDLLEGKNGRPPTVREIGDHLAILSPSELSSICSDGVSLVVVCKVLAPSGIDNSATKCGRILYIPLWQPISATTRAKEKPQGLAQYGLELLSLLSVATPWQPVACSAVRCSAVRLFGCSAVRSFGLYRRTRARIALRVQEETGDSRRKRRFEIIDKRIFLFGRIAICSVIFPPNKLIQSRFWSPIFGLRLRSFIRWPWCRRTRCWPSKRQAHSGSGVLLLLSIERCCSIPLGQLLSSASFR